MSITVPLTEKVTKRLELVLSLPWLGSMTPDGVGQMVICLLKRYRVFKLDIEMNRMTMHVMCHDPLSIEDISKGAVELLHTAYEEYLTAEAVTREQAKEDLE